MDHSSIIRKRKYGREEGCHLGGRAGVEVMFKK